MVPVGDAGNLNDTVTASDWSGLFFGAVAYEYQIGKYEVTNAQYAAFLNAVGVTSQSASDPYGLYNAAMGTNDDYGGIVWNGTDQEFQPKQGWEDLPVTYVSFYDAARFCNWLTTNGTSTETGMYTFSEDGMTIVTNPDHSKVTGWALPSEDEWYKAAYYNPNNRTYRTYPVLADSIDNTVANYYYDVHCLMPEEKYFARVDFFDNVPGAASSYGTFQQGGNVYEWNDTVISTSYRGARGGSIISGEGGMGASSRFGSDLSPSEYIVNMYGFRVVYLSNVPEPQTYALFGGMALLGLTLLRRRNK